MRVSIVGTGYVGLVSGACLAEMGHTVVCVDVNAARVAAIRRGESPIHEAGLAEILARHAGGRLRATTDLRAAVLESDLSLIAVGTPFDGERIDLGAVRHAATQVGRALREKDGYHVVAVKSTVVPGTTDGPVRLLLEAASGKRAGADFGLGMNPEFLREGQAVADFMHPDRLVLGGVDDRTRDALEALYAPFPEAPRIRTGNHTAETIKYAANALFATLISFSNEIGNLCAALGGTDVVEVMRGVHLDRRLTPVLEDGRRVVPGVVTYLEAGCGFGGSCFPKDVKALAAHGRAVGVPMRVLDAVVEVNERQPERIMELLDRGFPSLLGRRVAVLGLAFKPGTDDVRESPSLPVVRALRVRGAAVRVYDPVAAREGERALGTDGIAYSPDLETAVDGADAIAVMTRWGEFERLPALLAGADPQPLVVDGRRMLARGSVARYAGIGV
jgi:UDPglucose 6-dehydrogenase